MAILGAKVRAHVGEQMFERYSLEVHEMERIVLETAQLALSGRVATAVVRIAAGGRHVGSRSVGRSAEEGRLRLMGDAAARAVTELLPVGYGALLEGIHVVPTGVGDAVIASVLLLGPDREEVLLGVARRDEGSVEAAARSVLDAVNRRLGVVVGEPQPSPVG